MDYIAEANKYMYAESDTKNLSKEDLDKKIIDIISSKSSFSKSSIEIEHYPKYINVYIETNSRGPRIDHGGGDDGDGWMDNEQIDELKKPFLKKFNPILENIKNALSKEGFSNVETYLDYGEKGHINLQITIPK